MTGSGVGAGALDGGSEGGVGDNGQEGAMMTRLDGWQWLWMAVSTLWLVVLLKFVSWVTSDLEFVSGVPRALPWMIAWRVMLLWLGPCLLLYALGWSIGWLAAWVVRRLPGE